MLRDDYTPYSTISPFFFGDTPTWVPEEEQERIAAYLQYDDMYWNAPEAFKLSITDEDSGPIFVPKGMTIVDTTAHYLLKGLTVSAPSGNETMQKAFDSLFKREMFYPKFHQAKHSGVTRGDYILHITADPAKKAGKRISITSVHPGAYFPVYDDWDPDKLVRVHLAEIFSRRENGMTKEYIRRLTYEYVEGVNGRKVQVSEGFFETKDWFDPKKAKMRRQLIKTKMLPDDIDTIPTYHFKNIEWQGDEWGSSEMRGVERLLQAVNQTITDEEVALALEGLGVYATDAAGPVDPETNQKLPWEIAPARVMELPTGAYFKRVEGVGSVTPMLEHVKYLVEAVFEAKGTTDVALGNVDSLVAQSGIALAIKFQPTLARIEQRDEIGVAKLDQMMFDLIHGWFPAFEEEVASSDDEEAVIELGEKLPKDVTEELNELNNMYDRGLISDEFYLERMSKLRGYDFPENMAEQIAQRQQKKFEDAQKLAALNNPESDPGAGKSGVAGRPPGGGQPSGPNNSNNKDRPNESGGTEA